MEVGINKKYWNKKWWYYSEKIPTLAFNNLHHANVSSSLGYAVINPKVGIFWL